MSGSEVSVQLYTVRSALAADAAAALTRIADLGFRQVELFDFVGRAEELAQLLSARGLTVPSGHAMLIGEDVDAVLTAARAVGMHTVIQPMVPAERWASLAWVEQTAHALNEVAVVAARQGLQVGYHNHWWELENKIDDRPALEVFAELLDEAVLLEVDTYWVETGGVSAPELLRRLGKRVRFLHVKDGPATLDMRAQTALGAGSLNVPQIMAAAPGALKVIELDDYAGDVFDALRDSLAFLASHGLSA